MRPLCNSRIIGPVDGGIKMGLYRSGIRSRIVPTGIAGCAALALMLLSGVDPAIAGNYRIDCPKQKKLDPEGSQGWGDQIATVFVDGCICGDKATMRAVRRSMEALGKRAATPTTSVNLDSGLENLLDNVANGDQGTLDDLAEMDGNLSPLTDYSLKIGRSVQSPGFMRFRVPAGGKKTGILQCMSPTAIEKWAKEAKKVFDRVRGKGG